MKEEFTRQLQRLQIQLREVNSSSFSSPRNQLSLLKNQVKSTTRKDLTLLYAEPLATGSFAADPLNYQKECDDIIRQLKYSKRKAIIDVKIATRRDLLTVLQEGTTILHIMCHGDYDETQHKYFLAFEDSSGRLDRLYSTDLDEILSQARSIFIPSLVFMSACHSEEIANVFRKHSVEYVIASKADMAISELEAIQLGSDLYKRLFGGCLSVPEAYKQCQDKQKFSGTDYSCCCGHSHRKDCKWKLFKRRRSHFEACERHTHACNCEERHRCLHELGCTWAADFLTEFDKEGFDDYSRLNKSNQWNTCCCRYLPEDHKESEKYVLMHDSGTSSSTVPLLEGLEEGELAYELDIECFPLNCSLIGFDEAIFELYKWLRTPHVRKIVLHGKPGSGKTSLATKLANYVYARGQFQDGIYKIDCKDYESRDQLVFGVIEAVKNTRISNLSTFKKVLKNRQSMFVLDGCESILAKDANALSELLTDVESHTNFLVFLITTNWDQHSKLSTNYKKEVPKLDLFEIAQLLLASPAAAKIPPELRDKASLKDELKPFVNLTPQKTTRTDPASK